MSIRNEIIRNTGKTLKEAENFKPAKEVAKAYDKGSKEVADPEKKLRYEEFVNVAKAWNNLESRLNAYVIDEKEIGIFKAYKTLVAEMDSFIKKHDLEE